MSAAFPLRYARANVLFGRGDERAALYRLPSVSYPFLPVAEKRRELGRLATFAFAVQGDFSIWRVNRAYPAERYPAEVDGLLDERFQDPENWRRFLAAHQRRLRELRSHVPEVYAAISLRTAPATRMGGGMLRSLDRARRRLEDLAGVAGAQPVPDAELRALALAEGEAFDRLRGIFPGAERASTEELQWLLRRAACRGVAEPALDAHWEPNAIVVCAPNGEAVYEPLETDLVRCANAALHEHERALVIDAEEGRSHQAMLALGALPDDPEFPGARAELMFAPLDAVEFPVDAVLHARWVGNRQALAQVRKRIMDTENVFREQLEGSRTGPGWLAETDRELARELEAYLQSEAHPPMITASVLLALGAPSAKELERRVSVLREQYGDVALHRPLGLQPQLFFEHLPRAAGGEMRDYLEPLTIEQFGALMPTGAHHVGSTRGAYLGYTPGGGSRPVKWDPTEASRESQPSAILLAGTLGSGKTITAELLELIAERRGSLIVDVDPKPDHALHELPELDGHVEIIELSGDERYRGMLDPLRIAPPSLREELATSYFIDVLRDPQPGWANVIQRAVRDTVARGSTSSLDVIEQLRASDRAGAEDAADALELAADFGLGRLAFGHGEPDHATRAKAVTTIRAAGLSLPPPEANRADYSYSEKIAVATLSLVAAFALWLVSADRSRHKIVLFDEAWFLLASSQGRTLIDRLVRLGRAQNATLILATQQLGDVGPLVELIGTTFIFGQKSDAEAKRGLELLGLDPENPALVGRIRSYSRGRCLMRDLHDRIAEVQIDLVFDHLLDALDTTPRRAPIEAVT